MTAPRRTRNLLAACKNVGVTHVANGATPHEVWASPALTRALQRKLLRGGAPVAWTLNAPPGHPAFVTEQERALEVASQVRR